MLPIIRDLPHQFQRLRLYQRERSPGETCIYTAGRAACSKRYVSISANSTLLQPFLLDLLAILNIYPLL